MIEDVVAPRYRVTGPEKIIATPVDEKRGGRDDDTARAADVQKALANDNVAAIVCIRGGSWFARILPRIDFDVLRKRRRPVFVFGFSEMTPLIGIAGAYAKCVGLYDLGPGFLFGGVWEWAERNIAKLTKGMELAESERRAFAMGWAAAGYRQRFLDFFREVVDIVEGRGTSRQPTGHVVQGRLPARSTIRIVGGNMDLTRTMLASRYAGAFETRGRWLAIEDINESPDRLDRSMATIQLAGLLERAEGILLGDFHDGSTDLNDAMLAILRKHVPAGRTMPIVRIENFGHIWPIAPLPVHREVMLVVSKAKQGRAAARIEIPWAKWARR
jgi:muramoyltetrapeptide carboxypeptidase